jgi:hypothetical protein
MTNSSENRFLPLKHRPIDIGAVRIESHLPVAYRLVTKDDGNGNTVPVLQGYYTWTEGLTKGGGEWRDLATQDWLHADDKIPHSFLS